jgi:hypothetical protein
VPSAMNQSLGYLAPTLNAILFVKLYYEMVKLFKLVILNDCGHAKEMLVSLGQKNLSLEHKKTAMMSIVKRKSGVKKASFQQQLKL